MVRTSYEWITKSQCILILKKKLSMWHNLFMLYQKWHNAASPTVTKYAGTSVEGSLKNKIKNVNIFNCVVWLLWFHFK